MPNLDQIRAEIERMRVQVSRQRKEILQLQRTGINSLPAEALLARMLANIDNMCAERAGSRKNSLPRRESSAVGTGDARTAPMVRRQSRQPTVA
jgi:hypothetical protein